MKRKIRSYVISVAVSLGTGIVASLLTMKNMQIYQQVSTPALSPPSFLFPVVWTVLYVLMGVSAAMVYNTKTSLFSQKKKALDVYAVSLAVNFLWSIIFFNLNWFFFAFVWLVLLLFLVVVTIILYGRINPTAAYLQIPYALWVSFAGYLNLGIWLLNK